MRLSLLSLLHTVLTISISFQTTALPLTPAEYRNEIIKTVLKQYKRSSTVIELDAQADSVCFELSSNFPAICVMVTENKNVAEKCFKNEPESITLLAHPVTMSVLKNLSECEHFDVVLALNSFKNNQENPYSLAESIFQLGEITIIKAPKQLREYLKARGASEVAGFEDTDSVIFIFQHPKKIISRKHWWSDIVSDYYRLICSKQQKVLHHTEKNRYSFWHPGINFETFKALNGAWPSQKLIDEQLEELKDAQDIIIQGITLIEN